MVHHAEHLGARLEVNSFVKPELAAQGQVHLQEPKSLAVHCGRAYAALRIALLDRERIGVEPPAARAVSPALSWLNGGMMNLVRKVGSRSISVVAWLLCGLIVTASLDALPDP